MTTMVTEVYDALLEAGASEEKARRAAEVLTNYDDRFNRIELQLASVKSEMSLLRWVTGSTLALVVAVLVKLFVH